MKISKTQKGIFAIIILCCLLLPDLYGFTSGSFKEQGGKNYIQTKKVAILVVRVGNSQAFSPMTQISLKTDYSIRAPKTGTDVFIDDEKRLAQSVPAYPKYTGNTKEYDIEYFKNITPEIFESIKTVFEQKTYEVFDFRQISISWEKPFSEMTVKDIITALGDKVAFLFVFHYMDIGNSSINSKIYKVKASNSGFTSSVFTYSLFDVRKQKKIFSYAPLMGFVVAQSIIYNPEIMNNPELRKRIIANCDGSNYDKNYKISYDFTDSELIKVFSDNIINGFHCPGKKFIACFDECKYYEIRSLVSQIP